MRIEVECYSGYKRDERPLWFRLEGRCFEVEEVLDRWYGPEEAYFKVRADDGNLYILRHTPGEHGDLWTLQAFSARA